MRSFPLTFRRTRAFALLLVALASLSLLAAVAWAQGDAADPLTTLKDMHPKTLVFVFDVSGSMNDKGNLRRARQATIDLLREGVSPGDHVALLTFGANNQTVFDTTIASRSELAGLIDQVPTRTESGAGTNIRAPHHQALKLVDAGLPNRGAIVLLTDSFNDEPKSADAAYPGYLLYYTPGGLLTKYPNTPENRDYERLLKKLLASGKLTQFGIGIKIAADGRPIERLPVAETPAPAPTDDATDANANTPLPPAKPASPLPYVLGGAVLVLGAIAAFFLAPLTRASAVRISGGAGGAKDFQVRNGASVRIGGDGASAAFDAYPVAGAKEAVARVRGSRGQLFVAPTPPASNQTTPPRVYHNGLPLEKEEPLNFGDELRVGIPQTETGAFKEYRLKFEDPRKSF